MYLKLREMFEELVRWGAIPLSFSLCILRSNDDTALVKYLVLWFGLLGLLGLLGHHLVFVFYVFVFVFVFVSVFFFFVFVFVFVLFFCMFLPYIVCC